MKKEQITKAAASELIKGKLSRYFGVAPTEARKEQLYKAILKNSEDARVIQQETDKFLKRILIISAVLLSITSCDNKQNNKTVTKAIYASNHDRSGYAHFDNTTGVGAYNDDGSLKSNTVVVYVTDSNKNTVTAKLGSKTYTGLVAILQAAKDSNYPICIRIIGSVKTAQWNYKSHGEGNSSSRNENLAKTFANATFSKTVSFGNNLKSWKTTPNFLLLVLFH